ncbi:MAG: NAD(P)-dependent oxidoreductase [Tannerellaceae bacterium]|nr:NAD(P)-dependent oxidoreductase [Tannerellaceae bacterium]
MSENIRKKILITGASGFIGGFLVQEALSRGYEVWAGVRKSSKTDNLSDTHIHLIDLKYNSPEALTKQIIEFTKEHGNWDYVIHNAGLTKTINKKNFEIVNSLYTQHLIEALKAADCKLQKFILMSSLSSFGKGDESTFTPIRLTDPQIPDTAYGKSKLNAENYVRSQNWFPYIILRPTGVYGPGEKDYFMEIKSINAGIDFVVGRTPQRITFIYVKDLAYIAINALEKKEIKNKEYFVADGDIYTDEEFARLIQKIIGKKFVLRGRIPLWLVHIACICSEQIGKFLNKSMTLNSDKFIILKQRNWICDISPLQDDLNFKPSYNLEKGLEESIQWYREKGWL